MCKYCGRDFDWIQTLLPVKRVKGEGDLRAYIRKNASKYEMVFESDNGEFTLEISNCPMCQDTLVLEKVYYVKTKNGYICEDMSKKTGKLQTNVNKKYAFPCLFKSMAESVADVNKGEVIEEELFEDEISQLFSRFGY